MKNPIEPLSLHEESPHIPKDGRQMYTTTAPQGPLTFPFHLHAFRRSVRRLPHADERSCGRQTSGVRRRNCLHQPYSVQKTRKGFAPFILTIYQTVMVNPTLCNPSQRVHRRNKLTNETYPEAPCKLTINQIVTVNHILQSSFSHPSAILQHVKRLANERRFKKHITECYSTDYGEPSDKSLCRLYTTDRKRLSRHGYGNRTR